ncbi:hypothetical protein V1478_014309 [Vespula squamosa]|uniref:Uncharacterized protein n=1 Tax=Vespula squamosa TaxID=30214 RepID=A0ABD2A7P9_VESSQ
MATVISGSPSQPPYGRFIQAKDRVALHCSSTPALPPSLTSDFKFEMYHQAGSRALSDIREDHSVTGSFLDGVPSERREDTLRVITAITSDNIIGSHQGSSSTNNNDDDDYDDDDDDYDDDDEDHEDDDKDENRARVHRILELSRRGIRQDHPWWNSRMTEKRNYRNYLGMPRPKKKNKKNKNKKKKKKKSSQRNPPVKRKMRDTHVATAEPNDIFSPFDRHHLSRRVSDWIFYPQWFSPNFLNPYTFFRSLRETRESSMGIVDVLLDPLKVTDR